MTRSTRFVVSSALTFALAMPTLALAQASRRGGGDSSSSGSSGGDSGGAASRPAPDSSRSGSAAPRESSPPSVPLPAVPNSSGDRSTPASAGRTNGTGDNNSTLRGGSGSFAGPRGRDRENRPTTGAAARRTTPYFDALRTGGDNNTIAYYPWYSSGLNWYYTPYPYSYGASRWIWGRYGMWYDPFDPFGYSGYDPYGMGYGYGGFGSTSGYGSPSRTRQQDFDVDGDASGSVRLRVRPKAAKVYLDGTLMGSVDQFDGLRDHLVAPAGDHDVEIRADGYQTLKVSVSVPEDKTVTVRGSLKKN